MFGKKKNKKDQLPQEYIDLKRTVWQLQAIAYNLQRTANEFEERIDQLKEIQKATPDYLRRRDG